MSVPVFLDPAWPAAVVPLGPALAAVGASETSPPCPRCGSALHVTTSPSAGHWMSCAGGNCYWCGYAADYVLDRCGGDGHAAAAALKSAGVRIPAKTWTGAKSFRWRRHIEDLRSLRSWAEGILPARRMGPRPGQGWPAHNHPAWWAMSCGELAVMQRKSIASVEPEQISDPVSAVPGYDALFRVLGTASPTTTSTRSYCVGGTYGGLAFRHAIRSDAPAVLSLSVQSAFRIQTAHAANSATLIPVVAPLRFDESFVSQLAVDLPRGPKWIIRTPNPGPAVFKLAAILDAGIFTEPHKHVSYIPFDARSIYDQTVVKAVPWSRLLEEVCAHQEPWRCRAVLSSVGWPGRAEEAARTWSRSNYDRVCVVMGTRDEQAVEVERGLWVYETGGKWVCGRTGQVFAEALPHVHSVSLERGRKVYAGTVLYDGTIYQFKSRMFRRDPAGVVETCLLRNGIDNPAPPHPRIVRHMVTIACYFGRQDQK